MYLQNHGLETAVFLKEYDIDVTLISQTHFTNRIYLRLHNYIIYDTKPNGAAHGGSTLINKNKLKYYETYTFQKE